MAKTAQNTRFHEQFLKKWPNSQNDRKLAEMAKIDFRAFQKKVHSDGPGLLLLSLDPPSTS